MTEKRKFKVGDRVVYVGTTVFGRGKKGTITSLKTDGLPYDVAFDDFVDGHNGVDNLDGVVNHWYCKEEHLNLLTPAVSSNPHYDTSIQPIETMQANMTPEEFLGYLKGNIIKYACRCGRKDEPLKEAKKIKEYAGWLVDALEGKKIDPRAN